MCFFCLFHLRPCESVKVPFCLFYLRPDECAFLPLFHLRPSECALLPALCVLYLNRGMDEHNACATSSDLNRQQALDVGPAHHFHAACNKYGSS